LSGGQAFGEAGRTQRIFGHEKAQIKLATKRRKKYKQYIFFLLSFFAAKIIKHGFILATEDSEVTENRIKIP